MRASIAILLYCSYATAKKLSTRQNEALSIQVPAYIPTANVKPVSPDFAAFAFEERSFYSYFGTPENPNTFSLNLLTAIASKTNTTPHIRVGGSSLDASQYDPTQTEPIKIPPGQEDAGIPNNMTFGPSYFDAFSTIPNAKYIIDIPMQKNNLANSEVFALAAYEHVGADKIAGLEIGNEPDNYGWSKVEYVIRWEDWSARVLDTLGLGKGSKMFQAVGLASQNAKTGAPGAPGGWRVPDLFELGLKNATSRIKTVSMHYYQIKTDASSTLQRDIMNHTAIVSGTAFVKTALTYLNTLTPPIPLALGEVGTLLGGPNATQARALANVLGAVLWHADFALYTMALGVQRVSFQSGLGFQIALWSPRYERGGESMNAGVHAGFYGHVFAAEFVGVTGRCRVRELELGRQPFSGYAAYEGKALARVALVNLKLWSKEDGERPVLNVTLDVGSGFTEARIMRLTSEMGGTADVGNITWGGMQWTVESEGEGVQVVNDTTNIPVNGGKLDIEVKASEAVMIQLSS